MPSNLATIVLAGLAAACVAYVFIYPLLSGDARAEKRQKALVDAGSEKRAAVSDRVAALNRRDHVAQSLKGIEARERSRDSVTLETRIAQAGLAWSKGRFFLMSALLGLGLAAVLFVLTGGKPLVALGGLFAGGFGLPRWILGFLRNRRTKQFLDELPNAMDVIVRGLRSGLPLNDCIRIVAAESREPIRTEFRHIIEAQALGIALPESVTKIYERVPVPEANFFAIVIGIQSKSGGNLSEAISNLSKVVRERKKMKAKIKAVSSEAKASAGIIASLPFAVAILTYLSSPKYIELLWLTQSGKLVLFVAGCWMAVGVFVMKQMINFEI